jgi:hypothetical protein
MMNCRSNKRKNVLHVGCAYGAIILILVALALLSSCSGTKEVEHVYHHDTVYSNSVVHDSVDRWHTHYEFVKGDTLHVIDTFWRDRWHVAHDTAYKTVVEVQEKVVEKVAEKKSSKLWPVWLGVGGTVLLMWLGVLILGCRSTRNWKK